MLQHVIIVSPSGVVLFSKEYVPTLSQPRMMGSLLTAMIDFSKKTIQRSVAFLEFDRLILSLVQDPRSLLTCVTFHTRDDGMVFSRLITREILKSFLYIYPTTDFNSVLNLSTFANFRSNVVDAAQGGIRSILHSSFNDNSVVANRGVSRAFVTVGDEILHSTSSVDQVAVVGALQSMMALSTEAAFLADKKRPHDSVELLCNRHRIYIFPILCPTAGQNAFLVATCRRSLPPTYYHPKLQEAAVLTEQILSLTASLRGRTVGRSVL